MLWRLPSSVGLSEDVENDPDGLPTYTDPQGITWRQHPDGSMEWWDGIEGIWVKFES